MERLRDGDHQVIFPGVVPEELDPDLCGWWRIVDTSQWVNDGLDVADSYAFNPHKWLFTNFDCTCFWVADRSKLVNSHLWGLKA